MRQSKHSVHYYQMKPNGKRLSSRSSKTRKRKKVTTMKSPMVVTIRTVQMKMKRIKKLEPSNFTEVLEGYIKSTFAQ